MKFKKVEIQAFRAYQSIKDGTFDFEIIKESEKAVADFISIYAPNGFGKTSFYDAVEYGITNSIDRFMRGSQTKVAKNERQINKSKKGGQLILRNRYVKDSTVDSEVRLYMTNIEEPITRQVPKNSRSTSSDFHFDKGKIENEYFQTVMLSQEWIDAFLKIDDPKERYTKFMDYFGDKVTSEYYKKIVSLLSSCDTQIKDLNKQLKDKQLELNFEGDKEILKKVNDKIRELINLGEKLRAIDEQYTEDEAIDLSNIIIERITELEFTDKEQEALMQFIDSVFIGNENIVGIDLYYELKDSKQHHEERIEELNNLLKKYQEKRKHRSHKKSLLDIQKAKQKNIENVEYKIKAFPLYEKVLSDIKENQQEINKGIESNRNNDKEIKSFQLDEAKIKTEIAQFQKQIHSQNEDLLKVNTLNENINSSGIKYNELTRDIPKLKEQIEGLTKSIQSAERELETYEQALKNIDFNIYPSGYDNEFIYYKELLDEIANLLKQQKQIADNLDGINKKIKEQEELTKDIESFVANGSEIINKSQTTTCPLCNQEYSSFLELTEKISNNKFLSQVLSELLKTRSNIEAELRDITQKFKDRTKIFITNLNNLISEKRKANQSQKNRLKDDREALITLEEEKKILQKDIDELSKLLNEKSFQEYITEIENNINVNRKKVTDLKKFLNTIDSKLKEFKTEKEKNKQKEVVLEKTIAELKEDSNYKSVLNYFKANFSEQEISLNSLSEKKDYYSNQLKDTLSDINELNIKIKELEECLKETNEDFITKELKESNNKLEAIQKKIKSFELELKNNLKLEVEELRKMDLSEKLEEIKNQELEKNKTTKNKIEDFKLLEKLKQNIEPYLKYQKAKKEFADLESKYKSLKNNTKPLLEAEKEKVAMYLDNQVSSFFYEDLINDLYKRIDPHPDYNMIKFNCDFKEDKPKLNVCLYQDSTDDTPIIPNLYFSTAQLNILSLSIFLAKALNARDNDGNSIDSIFIDDPIQSMDSINILSTIDLFRSIVVNQEKQIILSTHDENFHNLLKKKMPSGLFKSKFMELETFGKVKKD